MSSRRDSRNSTGYFSGWRLTRSIAILLILHFVVTLVLKDIDKQENVGYLIRITAKLSFILFMLTFVASSLFHYIKNGVTTWLLTNRRYLGVSFAISHYIHLAALLLMTVHIEFNVFEDRGLFRTAIGATAYGFITIMTLTSFKGTRNLFGKNNWKRIHTVGGYLLWVIFAKSYLLEMTNPIRIAFASVAVVVLLLRLSVLFNKR